LLDLQSSAGKFSSLL